jgi:two-component system response regulator YesN
MGQIEATASLDGMKNWLGFVFSQLPESTVEDTESQDVVETLRRYIREHISEELGRNELANLVFLNPDYLSHVFRERTGMSLVDFITAERMKKARELLSTTDQSIRDIALSVGYSNISYFSRQFKRVQGQTPLEFRRSVTG